VLVPTKVTLANLILETKAVRLVVIPTLSHHAALVFAISRLEGVYTLDSLLLFLR
jgi:hypothetical protein